MPRLTASPAESLQIENIREEIHNLSVCRRRIARMLSGDLKIETRASREKLQAQLSDLDAEILRLRLDLFLLMP